MTFDESHKLAIANAMRLIERWQGKQVVFTYWTPAEIHAVREAAGAGNMQAASVSVGIEAVLDDWQGRLCVMCQRPHRARPNAMAMLAPTFEDPDVRPGEGVVFTSCAECAADPNIEARWVRLVAGPGAEYRAVEYDAEQHGALVELLRAAGDPDPTGSWPTTHGWGRA